MILQALRRAIVEPMEVSVAKKSKLSFDPKKFLAKVGEGKTITNYIKDQIVFSQGDPADAVFYIQKGKLKLTVISQQGKEAVIAILGPGHFFGEGCLNGHGLRVATTVAMDESVVTRIDKAAMIATLHSEPEFSELFIAYLLAIIQFQRKAPRPAAPPPREFRQGNETGTGLGENQSGNAGGNDRHHAGARESFHEQIP
jgi:CRP-like cAMP-binding protein